MKKKLQNQFQNTMDNAISCVNLLNPKLQRTMLFDNEFNPEQLRMMDDFEVRIQTIRTMFINMTIDNVIGMCDDFNEAENIQQSMWTWLKEWDEL